MEIEENILINTKCNVNFECLTNENHFCLKPIENSCIGGKVIFINCTEMWCNQKMSFGNSIICNCPTRKEIFVKYKK